MNNLKIDIDISSCDKEPIHLLGKVQSHGCLLAFDKQSFTLRFASANAEDYFQSVTIQNSTHIRDFLGSLAFQFVQELCERHFYNELFPHQVSINQIDYRCYFAEARDYIIAELEEDTAQENGFLAMHQFHEIASAIHKAQHHSVLYSTVVHAMKEQFGFDRVMMYVFDELGDGEIVAEAKEVGLDSFLGLKYPASDIPKQARRLYLTNISRSIRDVEDEGIPIQSVRQKEEALDLSYSVFRSTSPIHIQYLKNMGVTATHSISLVIKDELWGMILFHNYSSPKHLDFNNRLLAQMLGMNTAQAIELLTEKRNKKDSEQEDKLLTKIKFSDSTDRLARVIQSNWAVMAKRFKAVGYALLREHEVVASRGDIPSVKAIGRLHAQVVQKKNVEKIVFQNHIKEVLHDWSDEQLAGFLCLTITPDLGIYLYIWRQEKEQMINWAGNPDKSMGVKKVDNRLVLTPRASFSLWQEKVKNKSLPWSLSDLHFAEKLLRVIIDLEIRQLSTRLLKDNALKQEKTILEGLLTKKSEELYSLNLQLQEELKENRKYQRELEAAKLAGEQLNKLKSNFISTMSHEIRTPLNGIVGLAQLIVSEADVNEEVRTFGDLILESADRLTKTINRILAVSRIESEATQTELEAFNVTDFIEAILKPLLPLARAKDQNVVLNIHNKDLSIITDKHYFGQIFTNLLSNAIKYTPHKGYIEINIKHLLLQNQEVLYLLVEDNGVGIDADIVDKIFDPFFTENEVSKVPDNSSGLGLYLVKTYLQYLGGKITVESEKGKGAQFSVTIPVEKSNT